MHITQENRASSRTTLLFRLFSPMLTISAFTFGGGYAAMPLIRSQVVEAHGWMTMSEFADLITIAEMTPGPIQLNAATFAGMHVAGLPGAVFAMMGVVAPSLALVSLLACAYGRYRDLAVVKGVLGSLRPAIIALIASAGLSLVLLVAFGDGAPLLGNLRPLHTALFALALLLLRKKRVSPIQAMLLCGGAGLVLGVLFG